MAQLFPQGTNTFARASIVGGLGLLLVAVVVLLILAQSPWVTRMTVPREQPVPFSHQHHVAGDGIDCRYCHTSVEHSSFANIPPVHLCMTCHSVLWAEAPVLAPVRSAFRTGAPLAWVRVNDLPDFVYFDHSAHVQNGVGCTTCHGAIERMPLTWQAASLQMQWCLDCHRDPKSELRPLAEVFSVGWQPPPDQQELGARLLELYAIKTEQLTDCSICHR